MSPNDSPPVTPAPPAASAPAPGAPRRVALVWLVVLLLGALAAAAYTQLRLVDLRKDATRRFGELDQSVSRALDTATRADAEARAARERTALLEARLAEEQGQREALEQLYADLSRGRDEAVLVEVERLVAMAGQELVISGNVATALAALQTADLRLARTDSARFVPLRRVIGRDVDRLKAAPTVDITGMAVKLDHLIAAVDNWTLLADERAAPVAAGPAVDPSAPAPGSPWWERTLAHLQAELGEYRDLVRLRRVETPESLLLGPQQQALLRQQIKLRLLNARSALLMRNDRLFRADLAEAQALIARYVDTRQAGVAAAVTTLKQLSATGLSVEVPQINDSLAAVRAARTTPGR